MNKKFSESIAPIYFREIHLTTDKDESESIVLTTAKGLRRLAEFSRSRYTHYVRKFVMDITGCVGCFLLDDLTELMEHDDIVDLDTLTKRLLASLRRFPSLSTLDVCYWPCEDAEYYVGTLDIDERFNIFLFAELPQILSEIPTITNLSLSIPAYWQGEGLLKYILLLFRRAGSRSWRWPFRGFAVLSC